MSTDKKINVAYLHGRPGPHPMHGKMAKSVNAEFCFVDHKMQWQDKNRSIFYRMISSIVCALTLPNKKKYDIFLVDNLHFMPVIMKKSRAIKRKQKIVAYLGSHTLYFIYAHRFSKFNEWLHKKALQRYDALICEGKMAEELVKKILGNDHPPIYAVQMGIPNEQFSTFSKPNLSGKNILFIGHGPGKERAWYKGLDLMIDAFQLSFQKDPSLSFTIVGNWDEQVKEQVLSGLNESTKKAISFVGESNSLETFTDQASLYLHCARGEAFGITILIAMQNGIPCIISEWTGAKEAVEQVDPKFIVAAEKNAISAKIDEYFKLSNETKERLSKKGKEIALRYTEKNSLDSFTKSFDQLTKDLLKGK